MPDSSANTDDGIARRRSGERAARNVTTRVGAELVGKLATFLLFAVLARSLGEAGVGTFVLALAFLQMALVPVGLGTDSFLLRSVAKNRDSAGRLFHAVFRLKLTLGLPVLAIAFAVASLIGYDATTQATIYLLAIGVLLEILTKTFSSIFNAAERGDLLSAALVSQRVVTAILGIAALATGFGVLVVAALYSIGAAVGLLMSAGLMHTHVGLPARAADAWSWNRVGQASLPFALQDVFAVLLFKLDIIILSVLASEAAVGRYGVAYRLLESTMFIAWALNGAFAAMYTYLGRDTMPSVREVYGRSIKAALVLLAPCAVILCVLAEPICRLAFGSDFATAAPALRLLAPLAVGLCIVILNSSLIISRRSPQLMARITASVVVTNIALNLALIPPLEDRGAALAMLLTEVLFVAVTMVYAVREVGGIDWRRLLGSPLAATAAMLTVVLALVGLPLLAATFGIGAYVLCFVLVERRISPGDFDFIVHLLRTRVLRRQST